MSQPATALVRPALAKAPRPLQLSLASLLFWTVMAAAWFVLFRFHVGVGILGGIFGLPPLARTLWHMHRDGAGGPWPIERQCLFYIDSLALTVVTLGVCGFLSAAVAVLASAIGLFLLPAPSAFTAGGLLGAAAGALALRMVLRDVTDSRSTWAPLAERWQARQANGPSTATPDGE